MKVAVHHIVFGALAAATALAGALGGALAQTSAPEIDLEAIRHRAAESARDAEALASSARERAKTVTEQANTTTEQARTNGSRYSAAVAGTVSTTRDATFDFDRMVASSGEMAKADLGEAPRFIAFASTSMPPAALRQLIDDVPRAGGVVVFRGLTRGSARAMSEALSRVLKPGERRDGVGIDPRLFRAFGIDAVPAYVVTASDFDLCDGFDCQTQVPPFDLLSGNVTASFALETIARGGGPGARIAAQHLARLEGDQP
jgi:conjugal transfer pilus assembly protein TrbC